MFCYIQPGMETYWCLTRSHQSPGEQDWQFWWKWSGYKSGNDEWSCGVCVGLPYEHVVFCEKAICSQERNCFEGMERDLGL